MTQLFSQDPIGRRLYLFNREAFYKIRPMLPPPFEETPQGYAERDQAVIEAIVQFVPVNASETELAAMVVAGNQLWMHYMREARRCEHDKAEHDRLTAQAAKMGRDARGYLAALERAQKMRIKREATEAGAMRGDIIEENGRALMLASLSDPPKGVEPLPYTLVSAAPPPPGPQSGEEPENLAPAAEPSGEAAAEAAESASATVLQLTPVPRAVPAPAPASRRARAEDDDAWSDADWATEAEFYAINYPDRARLIRKLGGLPMNCDFGPPEPRMVRAIIAGTTPHLLKLDLPDEAAEQRLRRYA